MTPKLQHIVGGNRSNAIDAMGVKAKHCLDCACFNCLRGICVEICPLLFIG